MYVGYYVGDAFPFGQGNSGPYQTFPGTPGIPSGAVICPPVKHKGLGYYRPNQAFVQGRVLSGLGLDVQPTTLLIGIGALGVALFLLGGKVAPKLRRRRAAGLRRRRESLSRRIAALEA